jgi:hypothetical protein
MTFARRWSELPAAVFFAKPVLVMQVDQTVGENHRDILFSEFHICRSQAHEKMMITRPVYLRDESDQPLSGFRSLPE